MADHDVDIYMWLLAATLAASGGNSWMYVYLWMYVTGIDVDGFM